MKERRGKREIEGGRERRNEREKKEGRAAGQIED